MKRILILIACSMLGACHESRPTSPTPVTPPSTPAPAPTSPVLARPVIGWDTASTADRPGVVVTPLRATTAIRLIDAVGNVVANLQPGKHAEVSIWGWYFVQGQVAGNPNWSDLVAVPIFPNPCGGCLAPAPQPPPPPVCDLRCQDERKDRR